MLYEYSTHVSLLGNVCGQKQVIRSCSATIQNKETRTTEEESFQNIMMSVGTSTIISNRNLQDNQAICNWPLLAFLHQPNWPCTYWPNKFCYYLNKLIYCSCGNKMPIICNRWFLLQILLLAQHVSGTTMPIIRSSRLLYRWLLPVVFGVLWFSSCRYGV